MNFDWLFFYFVYHCLIPLDPLILVPINEFLISINVLRKSSVIINKHLILVN